MQHHLHETQATKLSQCVQMKHAGEGMFNPELGWWATVCCGTCWAGQRRIHQQLEGEITGSFTYGQSDVGAPTLCNVLDGDKARSGEDDARQYCSLKGKHDHRLPLRELGSLNDFDCGNMRDKRNRALPRCRQKSPNEHLCLPCLPRKTQNYAHNAVVQKMSGGKNKFSQQTSLKSSNQDIKFFN